MHTTRGRAIAAGFIGLLAWLGVALAAQAKDGVAEIHGAVQAMPPGGGLVGAWIIAGTAVQTDAATVIKQEYGAVGIGAIVEVKGTRGSDGTVAATRIEVESSPTGASPPPVPLPAPAATAPTGSAAPAPGGIDDSGLEIEGLIGALPAGGLLGTWQINGRFVVVTAATILDAERGPFAVGVAVEVHGAPDAAGNLVATRIERLEGAGATVPALLFWGRIESVPATTGFIGAWTVDGKAVNVSAATRIELAAGPIAIGAIVSVRGWTQPDGRIEAHEIETRAAVGDLAPPGTRAVEFVDDRSGRHHLTANPLEIAALDAAGDDKGWRRTGEAFGVGGSHAVCRFQGRGGNSGSSAFLTVDTAECRDVMSVDGAWTFDTHAFAITPAVAGQCPAETTPVHRLYRNDDQGTEVHQRYLASPEAIAAAIARGWIDEGAVMCARP
jgi:hypothetical protein